MAGIRRYEVRPDVIFTSITNNEEIAVHEANKLGSRTGDIVVPNGNTRRS